MSEHHSTSFDYFDLHVEVTDDGDVRVKLAFPEAVKSIGMTWDELREVIDFAAVHYLEVSPQQAGNIVSRLYREGFVYRSKAGHGYRYELAFPPPLPYHYFDRSPIKLEGEAAERAVEILTRRGKL